MYYRTCPYCGCNLDPGESCDCLEVKKKKEEMLMELFDSETSGQFKLKLDCFYRAVG